MRVALICGYNNKSSGVSLELCSFSKIIIVDSLQWAYDLFSHRPVAQDLWHLWILSYKEALKSNPEVIGYFRDAHATIAPVGTSRQTSYYCSSIGSELDKINDYFFPPVVVIAPSSTIKANQLRMKLTGQ